MKRKSIIVGALCIALLFGAFPASPLLASDVFTDEQALEAANINPDVNHDGYVDDTDVEQTKSILLGRETDREFDVNCDTKQNSVDLVVLRKFLTDKTQRDNDFDVKSL